MRKVIVPWLQMIACVLLQCGEAACTLLLRSGVRCFTDARNRANTTQLVMPSLQLIRILIGLPQEGLMVSRSDESLSTPNLRRLITNTIKCYSFYPRIHPTSCS
eukprot:scaffold867_cov196-Alexandrium_tamarense.AAC.6